MVFKLLFVRRSNVSFKIYVFEKRKIRSVVLSAQSTALKFGSKSISDTFVRTRSDHNFEMYMRNARFYNNCIGEFINFVHYARTRKILFVYKRKRIVHST